MESVFEPVVRTEETPEARIVIVHIPGFRKENLKVQVDNRGNLIISGERGVKEMEEMATVGGRLEKMQRFRKVIGIPQNLNNDGRITAKFRDQTLRISLPLRHISDQQNEVAIPASGKAVQSAQSKEERLCPAGQQDSIHEQSLLVAQDVQRARFREAIGQDDDKEKGSAAAQELKELAETRKTEVPKLAQDFAPGEPPISKDAQAASAKAGPRDESQFIEWKSKQDEEKHEEEKEAVEAEAEEEKAENEIPEKTVQIPCCPRRSPFFIRCCIVL